MATLTVQSTNRTTGLNTSNKVAASSGGDKWVGTGVEMLYVEVLTTTTVITLVLGPSATVDGLAPANPTISLAVGRYILGPFPNGVYNDANDFVNITYSQVSNVNVMAFKKGN